MASDDDYWAHYSTRGGLDSPEHAKEVVIQERGCSEGEWNERMQRRDDGVRAFQEARDEERRNAEQSEQERLDKEKEGIAARNAARNRSED